LRRDVFDLLLLLVLLAFVYAATGELRERVAFASRTPLRSDADLYRAPVVLADEYPLLEWIRANVPAGTEIAVPWDERFPLRIQRFWLALLPAYPIASDAGLSVCPRSCVGPDDVVLAQANEFVLVDRRAGRTAR
jgi:hypothetical protein